MTTPLLLDVAPVPPPPARDTSPYSFDRGFQIEQETWAKLGVGYLSWTPARSSTPNITTSDAGLGLELAMTRWLFDGWFVGGVGQFEHVGQTRAAVGAEAGYGMFGVELTGAQAFATNGRTSQASVQLAPFVSIGFAWISARWVLAVDHRGASGAAGDGAFLVVGVGVPVRLAAAPEGR